MAIDLRKNNDSLKKAYNQIIDDKDDTNWIIFGYEGQTSSLKVVGTGDGGIEEMAEDLSSGKMLYAYCKVKDPNTALHKYVMIHWTGESVPENVKLKYTAHLKDVVAFVKAVHVTVTARTESDIDEDDIIKKVSKASGANYSFHREKAKPEEAPAPVGTDYKRVRPDREINLSERDKFWSQTEKDEISRQKEYKSKIEDERKRLEDERKDREQREAKERDKRVADRVKEITIQKEAERKADQQQDKEEEKRRWAQVQKESSIDEEERGHRSDQMRKERVAEAAQLVSSSTSKSRDFFKQKSTERPDISNRGPPPPRKVIREFGNKEAETEQPPSRQEPPRPAAQPSPPSPPAQPIHEPEPEPEPEPAPQVQPEPQQPERESISEPAPPARDLLKQSLPPRQASDSEEDPQDWDEIPAEDSTFQGGQEAPATTVDEHQQQEEQVNSADASTADQGLCARALYDYQAADDTEITFDPDDIITNIEQIDDGWWQGFGPDGSYGMFPANYVELING